MFISSTNIQFAIYKMRRTQPSILKCTVFYRMFDFINWFQTIWNFWSGKVRVNHLLVYQKNKLPRLRKFAYLLCSYQLLHKTPKHIFQWVRTKQTNISPWMFCCSGVCRDYVRTTTVRPLGTVCVTIKDGKNYSPLDWINI